MKQELLSGMYRSIYLHTAFTFLHFFTVSHHRVSQAFYEIMEGKVKGMWEVEIKFLTAPH